MTPRISAVQHRRRLRGGSQSHLLRASDGASYVTKFQNNPQHIRVLANEMLAARLGLALGLPMPRVEVIDVSDWLITDTSELRIQLGGAELPCQSGKQLASLYLGTEMSGLTVDYLPRELLESVRNIGDFARVLALDKWTCNADGRQAIFTRKSPRGGPYNATFIDQGFHARTVHDLRLHESQRWLARDTHPRAVSGATASRRPSFTASRRVVATPISCPNNRDHGGCQTLAAGANQHGGRRVRHGQDADLAWGNPRP